MSEPKFTKGPWVARGSTPSRIYGMLRTDKEVLVAACGSVIEQAGANAHLIAAAPEMYELLNEAREFIASDPNCGPCGLGLICMIDDLLAKARGETDDA